MIINVIKIKIINCNGSKNYKLKIVKILLWSKYDNSKTFLCKHFYRKHFLPKRLRRRICLKALVTVKKRSGEKMTICNICKSKCKALCTKCIGRDLRWSGGGVGRAITSYTGDLQFASRPSIFSITIFIKFFSHFSHNSSFDLKGRKYTYTWNDWTFFKQKASENAESKWIYNE